MARQNLQLTPAEIERRQRAALAGHIPGTIHTHKDGTRYLVTPSGAWKRLGTK